jgi:ABC-type lipoprotein release transport system permease subunit
MKHDLSCIGISVVMMVVIGLACYLPGRRGTKIEPMVVLKSE